MDIVGGLTAAKLALDITKDLRSIDRSLDEAAFKLKLAELTSALAEAQVALSDAKLELNMRSECITDLEAKLAAATNGAVCPKCREGRMQLSDTRFYSMMGLGHLGVQEWDYICDNAVCGFEQTQLNDPHGAVASEAKKRR